MGLGFDKASLAGLPITTFWKCPHQAFPLCALKKEKVSAVFSLVQHTILTVSPGFHSDVLIHNIYLFTGPMSTYSHTMNLVIWGGRHKSVHNRYTKIYLLYPVKKMPEIDLMSFTYYCSCIVKYLLKISLLINSSSS